MIANFPELHHQVEERRKGSVGERTISARDIGFVFMIYLSVVGPK
jgi:hypothetical protein